MLRAMLNRATLRVADTTEVSGRVTADSIKHELYGKKQSSLWRLTIFAFCNVWSLVAATLILPALAYAQNNQGNGGPSINLGIPNGTYVYTISGYYNQVPIVPIAASGRTTYFADGTTSGVSSFSIGGTVYKVTVAGTFTVNADGSVSETEKQTSGPLLLTLHFDVYPTPNGNTLTILETDLGSIATGTSTR
jgi:hypothetical protein